MTPPIVWTDVLAHAPELSTIAVSAQADILALVNDAIQESAWGSSFRTKLARIYYAAHLATVSRSLSGAGGPIVSESEGGVSVTYATPQQITTTELGESRYGRLYLELRRHLSGRVGMVL
jgi:uncharacterized protein DUF4054